MEWAACLVGGFSGTIARPGCGHGDSLLEILTLRDVPMGRRDMTCCTPTGRGRWIFGQRYRVACSLSIASRRYPPLGAGHRMLTGGALRMDTLLPCRRRKSRHLFWASWVVKRTPEIPMLRALACGASSDLPWLRMRLFGNSWNGFSFGEFPIVSEMGDSASAW